MYVYIDVGTAIICTGETDVFAFAGFVPFASQISSLPEPLTSIKASLLGMKAPFKNQLIEKNENKIGFFIHRKFLKMCERNECGKKARTKPQN